MQRQNIVFILSDDQGAWAMGCAGNTEIVTPNLDRLAASGIRLDNFFCASPVCSPARASLMTGKIPSQHGVHDWIRQGHVGEGAIPYLQGQRTYVELLAEKGYVCGLSGKWHLGDNQQPATGFSYWYAHQSGGSPYYDAPMVRDGELYHEPRYLTEVITDYALQFLQEREQAAGPDPFYLSVHYTAPHSPWIDNHPEQYVQLYADCPFESAPQEEPHPWTIPNAPWGDDWRANLQGYYAAVTAMDEQIGRILDKIEQMGERENTLIIFMSDNGFSCGQHGFWGKGNGTFPQNMYDSSVKVPAIFSHPGTLAQGIVQEELLSAYDFMPTLLEYAGIEAPERDRQHELPGASFYSLLTGGPSPRQREDVVVFDEYGPVRMIRSKTWKYIHRYPYGPHELYHLERDPEERCNLVDDESCAAQLTELRSRLHAWFVQYADPAADGAREAVTGAGQLGLAGVRSQGRTAFAPLDAE